MIKCLIFDNGNVLVRDTYVDFKAAIKKKYPQKSEELLLVVSEIGKSAAVGKITFAEFRDRVNQLIGETETFEKYIYPGEVDEKMFKIVSDLKDRFDLVMLTNDLGSFEEHNKDVWKWEKVFDEKIFQSSRIGISKPSQEIYELVLSRLGYAPNECVFIDDKEKNVVAATKLGIHGIIFTSAGQFTRDLNMILQKENG